jgi:hypothetical protein
LRFFLRLVLFSIVLFLSMAPPQCNQVHVREKFSRNKRRIFSQTACPFQAELGLYQHPSCSNGDFRGVHSLIKYQNRAFLSDKVETQQILSAADG